jgi:DNA-binding HxlR family transcriptional regulator
MSSELSPRPNQQTATFTDPQEAIHEIHDIVGRKWQPVVLYYLFEDGPSGFSALKRQIDGISSKMLSDSLDRLEAENLIAREVLRDRPVRVEYSLTTQGESFEPLVREMVRHGAGDDSWTDESDTSGAA